MTSLESVKKYINSLSITEVEAVELENVLLGYVAGCERMDKSIQELEAKLADYDKAIDEIDSATHGEGEGSFWLDGEFYNSAREFIDVYLDK